MRYHNKYYHRREPVTVSEIGLVNMYHRLNDRFVALRDAGKDIEPIYARLKKAERRINELRLWTI